MTGRGRPPFLIAPTGLVAGLVAVFVVATAGIPTLAPIRAALAQAPPPSGFLCCNMRANGTWISDINYHRDDGRLIAAGTPVRGTSWGRYSIGIRIDGAEYWLGNDYSRSLDDQRFARRYILAQDPLARLTEVDPYVRDAITRARIMVGMTADEVAMALGYPVASYTPSLAASAWKYWIDRSGEFTVYFNGDRQVRSIGGEPRALAAVLYSPRPEAVRRLQVRLNEYGFEVGRPDGRVGPATRKALRDFQELNDLRPTGRFDLATLKRLGGEP